MKSKLFQALRPTPQQITGLVKVQVSIFLFCFVNLSGFFLAKCQSTTRSNILVIVLDDARYDSFEPNGGPGFFDTPAINSIALEGANFKSFFVTTAVCSPSRASIYTGLYAHHHGCRGNAESPDEGLTYISSVLKDGGYYTGFIGKWLLNYMLPDTPVGFNYWAITDSFEHKDPLVEFNDGSQVEYDGYDSEIFTDLAIDFWNNRVPSGQPWLLFMSHRVPHTPFQPRPEDSELYENNAKPFPGNFDYYQKNFPSLLYPDKEFTGDSAELVQDIEDYFQTLYGAEASTDSLLSYLSNHHLLDSTLILFTSDNGYFFGEHRLTSKLLAYEESMRVPLFIRYPAWFAPGTVFENEIMANIDIAPSLLEAAGIADTFDMDGVSLHALATGAAHRQYLFFEHIPSTGINWEAVRSNQYKYIYYYCNQLTEEFFDLVNDPAENINLIFDPTYSDIIEHFRLLRDSLRVATGDNVFPSYKNCHLNSFFYLDSDQDGFGNESVWMEAETQPGGYTNNRNDCNDSDSTVNPNAVEFCNTVDDDCDGAIDEGLTTLFYNDGDDDGYGNPNSGVLSCTAPSGYVTDTTDCNDADSSIHLNASDICNSIDDNCNAVIDENAITASVAPSGIVPVCVGSSITLTANAGSGISYQWVKGSIDIPGATNQTHNTIKGGVYKVKETNSFNCNSTSPATTIVAATAPAAAITPLGNLDICLVGTVKLQANSGIGFTYKWLKNGVSIAGATNQTYVATVAAIYQVKVTNSNGCGTISTGIKVIKSCKEGEMSQEVIASQLSVYPNPTDGKFIIEMVLHDNETDAGPATIELINTFGQIIYSQKVLIENGLLKQEIPPGHSLANGLYLVRLTSNDKIYSSQIVYQK